MRDPTDAEFHRIRTDATAAIEMADIYLSPPTFPQRNPQSENMQPPEILRPSITPNAPAGPSAPTRVDTDAVMATQSAGEAIEVPSGMQVDDDTIELGLRQDEWERLLEEPMEQTADQPTADHDPRDGSCELTSEPVLPPLGPGDIEVVVDSSAEAGMPATGTVENKTVRVESAELPPGAPAQIMCRIEICRGCKRAGHTANSCPLTSFQQYRLEEWTEKGRDNLPAPADESGENLMALALAPRAPTLGDPDGGATRPPIMADQADGKTATIPVQTAETPSTNPERNVDDENKTSTNDSPSSIGARTKARVRKATTQPDVGSAPVGEHSPIDKKLGGMHNGLDKPTEPTEKAPSEPAKASKLEKKIPDTPAEITRPVANVTGKAKTPGTNDNKKTVSEQILHKLATTKSRPESKPQTGTSKPKKVEKTNTSQTHETDAGDSDEIIITHVMHGAIVLIRVGSLMIVDEPRYR